MSCAALQKGKSTTKERKSSGHSQSNPTHACITWNLGPEQNQNCFETFWGHNIVRNRAKRISVCLSLTSHLHHFATLRVQNALLTSVTAIPLAHTVPFYSICVGSPPNKNAGEHHHTRANHHALASFVGETILQAAYRSLNDPKGQTRNRQSARPICALRISRVPENRCGSAPSASSETECKNPGCAMWAEGVKYAGW